MLNHLPVLHRKLPLDTRPIPRPIRWMICPFVSIESREQLHQHRARTAAPVWGTTVAPAPSAHSCSVITGRVQQIHHHWACTAAPVWGATAAPAAPSAHSSSNSIERAQQLLRVCTTATTIGAQQLRVLIRPDIVNVESYFWRRNSQTRAAE